ncbi:MAG: TonB-dependent receptor [Hyphomonadaceae bacterium]|nr:TonB-dependent receptor [Hyphomonadaceae bacterium]
MTKRSEWLNARLGAVLTLALGGVASAIPAAYAQQDDTIVVTATRRETALQDVPIAVTAVTADTIQNSGIRDIQDLTSVVPSLQFNVSESEASATARLRGVGTQGSNPGLESAVGIFIDGVYRARNGVALSDLGEVQQIEVLRGPQGTLFGRNTSAGLITVATVGPNLYDYAFTGEATYGEFEERRISAGVNIPLAPGVVGFRAYAAYGERDGFMDVNSGGINPLLAGVPNNGAGTANSRGLFTARGQLLWQLTDNIDMRIIADFTERDETCCAAQIYNPVLLNGNPVTNLNAAGVAGAPIPFGTLRTQWIANLGGYGPNVTTGNPLGGVGAGNIGDRRAFSNRGYPAFLQDRGVSAEFNWDMGSTTLTSISAYRVWTSAGGSDSDYSQADVVYVPQSDDVGTEYRTFTQEIRLAGTAGPVDWLVGAFFSNEEIDRNFAFVTGSQYGRYISGLDSLISGGSITPGLNIAPSGGLLSTLYDAALLIPGGVGQFDQYSQTGQSLALFTHNIISLTPSTDLTIGVRYTQEEKELTGNFRTPFAARPLFAATMANLETAQSLPAGTLTPFTNCNPTIQPTGALAALATPLAALRTAYCVPWLRTELDGVGYNQSRDEQEWSGVVSLRQAFSSNISGYVSASRGYKGGGFNLDRNFDFTFRGGAPVSAFDAELVDAYEIGLKTSWFDNSLLLNLAVYQNNYENFQLNTYNGIQFVVSTVPEVIAEGAELDIMWRTPLQGLSFAGGVAYTDARYGADNGWVAANRNPITGEQTLARLPNQQLTNAPEWTATASVNFETPIGDSLRLLAYLDARYVGDQNTGSDLRPSKVQPAYTLLNGRIGIGDINEHWTLELWARNITDEDYAQIMFDVPLQQGTAGPTQGAFLGDPRTMGITLRARY